MNTMNTKEYELSFDDSQEAKERVYKLAFDWFLKNEMFSGESISQSDTTYEEAPEILSEIAEKGFRFQAKWKEDF